MSDLCAALGAPKRLSRQVFPNPQGSAPITWDGTYFISEADKDILSYAIPCGLKGWSDELTDCHEEIGASRHPFNIASINAALLQCQKFIKQKSHNIRLLEIGSSNGFFLRHLVHKWPGLSVCGSDIIDAPLKALASNLRQEGTPIPLLRFDLTSCPLPDNEFDIVVALNVLEHIEDHQKALSEIYRILKPGGIFIFEVPVGPGLYDSYDRELLHFRRYDASSIDNLFTSAGLKRQCLSYLGFFLYPPFWIIKKFRSYFEKNKAAKISSKPGSLSGCNKFLIAASGLFFLKPLIFLELFLGRYINWPCGIRCNGVFKK
jgi:SAM-dependent methyltransferase